ncbi:MAG: hypothetical protein J6P44_09220 [Bacteroidales bacterium]|nr:hypothetical protein [Bacteroidales bacterium]
MENFYILSDSILTIWQQDLDIAENKITPSQEVIDAILDYATSKEVYSPTLKKYITISIN